MSKSKKQEIDLSLYTGRSVEHQRAVEQLRRSNAATAHGHRISRREQIRRALKEQDYD